jgi:hypothetical protein
MTEEILSPNHNFLTQEYVLVQAWKKTASYIRYHNWYSDTLELDRTAANLPDFLAELTQRLTAADQWVSDPLRIVPAPKCQQWRVAPDTKRWEPVELGKLGAKLRPLAHVSLRDQVAATAMMICLADRIETLQGDTRAPIKDPAARKRVLSYGNRLFCDASGDELHHRWGSGKLYRAYYQDYRTFLQRPEVVAESIPPDQGTRVVVVQTDFRQFFDRVQPALLAKKLEAIKRPGDDERFFDLARRMLDWQWSPKDSREISGYAKEAELSDFTHVALPQGLVAAGFFANLVLLDFDAALGATFSKEIATGVCVEDVCRYVDDLRIVIKVDRTQNLLEVEHHVAQWLQELLNKHAEGLLLKGEKTKAALFQGDERLLIRQSRKMGRIQSAVSGGFDAIGGEEILDAVQGLIRAQERYSEKRLTEQGWSLSPIPDVRDETVARFAAGRFRSTYRSLRPLLVDRGPIHGDEKEEQSIEFSDRIRTPRSRSDLDNEARAFALGLIEYWVQDPSNVRLLRIGLDIWPDKDVINNILNLLRPFTERRGKRKAPRRVAWYCLAEILRAAATETGIVEDKESLPEGIDIAAFRAVLYEEAIRLLSRSTVRLPWYLRQQILLFIAVTDPQHAPIVRTGFSIETRHYRELIRFLRGEADGLTVANFATLAILSRRSFLGSKDAVRLAAPGLTPRRLEEVSERDPSFGLELLSAKPEIAENVSPRLRDDLCLRPRSIEDGWVSLAMAVLDGGPIGFLRNELSILRFSMKFLDALTTAASGDAISPSDVILKTSGDEGSTSELNEVRIIASRVGPEGSMYRCPPWCPRGERWRFELGYLLRFILSAKQDFTDVTTIHGWREKEAIYRVPSSHWYQRLYGLYNSQAAFGDDWLPISDWIERFLSALLQWPGCRSSETTVWVKEGVEVTREHIDSRLRELSMMKAKSGGLLMIPISAPWPRKAEEPRPLRVCVVQTVIPSDTEIVNDLQCSTQLMRRRHRNHLSAALAAIRSMLDLRETHRGRNGRLDWLIMPELAVHPMDVRMHLIPFARAHKTIILAGLTYQQLVAGQLLVNSALWVIPSWSSTHGLQMVTRRQGKEHLSADELRLNNPTPVLQRFRPCQWLIGYEWSGRPADNHLHLTASVCYDATDLSLAAALRHYSDVSAIPALNRDVGTFDQMALALHYHMFQLVIVANNGSYGGSNAYEPYKEAYHRQVLHLHGQPQATVAFLEIDDIAAFLRRRADALSQLRSTPNPSAAPSWKFPPAGL